MIMVSNSTPWADRDLHLDQISPYDMLKCTRVVSGNGTYLSKQKCGQEMYADQTAPAPKKKPNRDHAGPYRSRIYLA